MQGQYQVSEVEALVKVGVIANGFGSITAGREVLWPEIRAQVLEARVIEQHDDRAAPAAAL